MFKILPDNLKVMLRLPHIGSQKFMIVYDRFMNIKGRFKMEMRG